MGSRCISSVTAPSDFMCLCEIILFHVITSFELWCNLTAILIKSSRRGTSHSSLLLRLMRPPVRPPRLRCTLFPLIYLPHLLVLPATFGLHLFEQTYPYFPALYVVPVRQAKGLPTASFRFHLAMDTLAVQLCTSSLPTRTRDFHPLERAHGAQTEKSRLPNLHAVFAACL